MSHRVISMYKLLTVLSHFKWLHTLETGMLWVWFWSTEEEKSAAATLYEILTVINAKITVLWLW